MSTKWLTSSRKASTTMHKWGRPIPHWRGSVAYKPPIQPKTPSVRVSPHLLRHTQSHLHNMEVRTS